MGLGAFGPGSAVLARGRRLGWDLLALNALPLVAVYAGLGALAERQIAVIGVGLIVLGAGFVVARRERRVATAGKP